MSKSKLKLKSDSWFYSHLGHRLLEGKSQEMSPPGIYLLSIYNEQLFTFLQKLYNV